MKTSGDVHLEELAVFVHGLLFFGHMLGIVHNVKRRNKLDIVAHTGAAAYDLYAVFKHLKSLRHENI